MKYAYYIVDVFSSEPFGGNQLAVLPNATGLSTEGMHKIAREFNFAETTFVFPPRDPSTTARVRIFTPGAEVDFAGHPTVGTACALVYGGHADTHELILDENIGHVPVKIVDHDGILSGTLTNSSGIIQPDETPNLQHIAEILGLRPAEVLDSFHASVGLDFCITQLSSREAVDKAVLDKSMLFAKMGDAWSKNMFFFAGELAHGNELYARMCSPALGIEEDPATGSAVAALLGVAAKRSEIKNGQLKMDVIQGAKIERLSRMTASADIHNGQVVSVSVGGATAMTAKGEMEVPEQWRE